MIDLEISVDHAALAKLFGAADEAADAMAAEILGGSQAAVPVKTGELKRSGKVAKSSPGSGKAVVIYSAPHSLAIEFGKSSGREFLRKSAMSKKVGQAAADSYERRLR